ncbi:hypothetical protein PoB_005460200 [Plakobranchus ocellatus]|uniref:Uncharacterized protein n=1 Tax=Plakobranchus ocellatus TaxID=259542 RepID=A0AAV4C9Z1_9GAST|nr:hypothetical protein PoB_005460200 [Plakobranchus ocellatus]
MNETTLCRKRRICRTVSDFKSRTNTVLMEREKPYGKPYGEFAVRCGTVPSRAALLVSVAAWLGPSTKSPLCWRAYCPLTKTNGGLLPLLCRVFPAYRELR